MPVAFPGLNRAGQLNGAAILQQSLGQRGLTRIRVRDNGERSPQVNLFRLLAHLNKAGRHKEPAATTV